jgi:hypothetical protein
MPEGSGIGLAEVLHVGSGAQINWLERTLQRS